jgi:hypothetical protein
MRFLPRCDCLFGCWDRGVRRLRGPLPRAVQLDAQGRRCVCMCVYWLEAASCGAARPCCVVAPASHEVTAPGPRTLYLQLLFSHSMRAPPRVASPASWEFLLKRLRHLQQHLLCGIGAQLPVGAAVAHSVFPVSSCKWGAATPQRGVAMGKSSCHCRCPQGLLLRVASC